MENDAFYVILLKMTHFNPTIENVTMENVTMEKDVVPGNVTLKNITSLIVQIYFKNR